MGLILIYSLGALNLFKMDWVQAISGSIASEEGRAFQAVYSEEFNKVWQSKKASFSEAIDTLHNGKEQKI